jgi:hypothetical protein
MVGLDISKVDYFEAARQRGLGVSDEGQIEIRGKSIDEVYQKMWLPYIARFETWPEYKIMHEGSCSSCQSLAAYSMEKLKALGQYDKNTDAVIVLGSRNDVPEDIPPEKLILCGNCTKKYWKRGVSAQGCPPSEPFIVWAIMDRKNQTDVATYVGPSGESFRDRMAADEGPWMSYIAEKVKEHRAGKDAEPVA